MSDNQDALRCADALERRGYASLTMQTRLADHEIAAHIRRLVAENEALKTVMIAAAEEISANWDAHCDADGYGPANLMHRLEKGIPSQYGYTAGDFAQLGQALARAIERNNELEAELAEQARVNGMGSERELRLKAVNAEMVEALRDLEWAASGVEYMESEYANELSKARAALAKVEASK